METFKAENEIIDAQGRLITDDEISRLNEQLSQPEGHGRTGRPRLSRHAISMFRR